MGGAQGSHCLRQIFPWHRQGPLLHADQGRVPPRRLAQEELHQAASQALNVVFARRWRMTSSLNVVVVVCQRWWWMTLHSFLYTEATAKPTLPSWSFCGCPDYLF